MQFLIFFLAKSCIICNRFILIKWKLKCFSVCTSKKIAALSDKEGWYKHSNLAKKWLFEKQSYSGTFLQYLFLGCHHYCNISFSTAFITHLLSGVLFINYTLNWLSGKQHTIYHQRVYSFGPYHLCIHLMITSWQHCRFSTTSPSSLFSSKF